MGEGLNLGGNYKIVYFLGHCPEKIGFKCVFKFSQLFSKTPLSRIVRIFVKIFALFLATDRKNEHK